MELDFFWSWKVMEFELPKRVWTLSEQLLCVYVFRPRRSGVCASAASTGRGEGGCSTDGRSQASLAHHEDEGIPRRARADRHGDAAVWLAPCQPVRPTADQRTHSAVVETQSDQRPQSRWVERQTHESLIFSNAWFWCAVGFPFHLLCEVQCEVDIGGFSNDFLSTMIVLPSLLPSVYLIHHDCAAIPTTISLPYPPWLCCHPYYHQSTLSALIVLPSLLPQASTISFWSHWPRGPVDLKSYWPEKKLLAPILETSVQNYAT